MPYNFMLSSIPMVLLYIVSLLVFPGMYIMYRLTKLDAKKRIVASFIEQFKDVENVGKTMETARKLDERLTYELESVLSAKSFAMALIVLSLVLFSGNTIVLAYFLQQTGVITNNLSISEHVVFAYLGGYFLILSSFTLRYQANDIYPGTFYSYLIQLPLSAIVGYFGSSALKLGDLSLFTAFAVGMLPVTDLMAYVRRSARKQMQLDSPEPEPITDIYKIQGLRKVHVDRLAREDILSLENLAYSNPFRVFLVTHFQMKLILDWVDQALLHLYISDDQKVKSLQGVGIRGIIQLAAIRNDPDRAQTLYPGLRQILEYSSDNDLERLLNDLHDNPHVMVIWSAWEAIQA
jgi:hypothetical protein